MTASETEGSVAAVNERQVMAKLVGSSPAFVEVMEQLPGLARSDATVLIEGETGTGKELFARAIHYLGPRAALPFIPINCGALTDSLLQDELFGHDRGAFTDARDRRPGLLAEAEKGTLFLDEVDSLSPRAQVALLRVLQDGTFRALGGTREQRVDVRFIAATNSPLLPLLDAGTFRKDLYYRLFVYSLNLPSLRQRGEDVLRLAQHFIRKHGPAGAALPELSSSAAAMLLSYPWPGNVRELENATIRGIQRCRTGRIEVADLGLATGGTPGRSWPLPHGARASGESFKARKKRLIESFERQYLTDLLCEHRGNVTHSARAAGRERRDFGKLLKKYQIDAKLFVTSIPERSNMLHAK